MNQLIDLTVDECVELLHSGVVGRVALQTPVGLRVVPVNYAMYRDSIVWRTAPYSELGTYGPGLEAVFEVDDIDYAEQRAWSVIAGGTVQIVDDPDEVADIRRIEDPAPWAPGHRHLYMRLAWRDINGRRIGETGVPATLTPRADPLTPSAYR